MHTERRCDITAHSELRPPTQCPVTPPQHDGHRWCTAGTPTNSEQHAWYSSHSKRLIQQGRTPTCRAAATRAPRPLAMAPGRCLAGNKTHSSIVYDCSTRHGPSTTHDFTPPSRPSRHHTCDISSSALPAKRMPCCGSVPCASVAIGHWGRAVAGASPSSVARSLVALPSIRKHRWPGHEYAHTVHTYKHNSAPAGTHAACTWIMFAEQNMWPRGTYYLAQCSNFV